MDWSASEIRYGTISHRSREMTKKHSKLLISQKVDDITCLLDFYVNVKLK